MIQIRETYKICALDLKHKELLEHLTETIISVSPRAARRQYRRRCSLNKTHPVKILQKGNVVLIAVEERSTL